MAPLLASAEVLKGRLNGHDCAESGKSCPIDRLDPHIALESDFVLQRPNGDYLFLMNLPRDIKIRYVLEEVRVEGVLNNRYNSVHVDEFAVKTSQGYRTVWSQAAVEQARQRREKLRRFGTWSTSGRGGG